MNGVTKFTVIATLALASTWSGITAAADHKVHSGAMCQPLHGSQIADFRFTLSGIYNQNQTSSRNVTCPIVRDVTTNIDGVTVRVRVDRSDTTNRALTCRLYSRNFPGNGYYQDSDSTSVDGDDELVLMLDDSYSGNDYTMYCTLPARSLVVNYVVEE